MSIDILQEKIRKRKNPFVLELGFTTTDIPVAFLDEASTPSESLGEYCRALLNGLKGSIPAVRFHFGAFSLLGADGLAQLQNLLMSASEMKYYVLLDVPDMLSPAAAEQTAKMLFGENSAFYCDGVVIPGYLGNEILKPLLPYCKKEKKSVFVVARTGNKTAPEVQDLLAGSRLVHTVVADYANRSGIGTAGKSGYQQVGVVGPATSADRLRFMRSKYPSVFVLVDGYDYPAANSKNCALAFDKFGHGAAICAGASISGAWKQAQSDGTDYLEYAQDALERMKKNLARYSSIL